MRGISVGGVTVGGISVGGLTVGLTAAVEGGSVGRVGVETVVTFAGVGLVRVGGGISTVILTCGERGRLVTWGGSTVGGGKTVGGKAVGVSGSRGVGLGTRVGTLVGQVSVGKTVGHVRGCGSRAGQRAVVGVGRGGAGLGGAGLGWYVTSSSTTPSPYHPSSPTTSLSSTISNIPPNPTHFTSSLFHNPKLNVLKRTNNFFHLSFHLPSHVFSPIVES